jgi:hypothetical protein
VILPFHLSIFAASAAPDDDATSLFFSLITSN